MACTAQCVRPPSRGAPPRADWAPAEVHEAMRGAGQPLDGATRVLMETRFTDSGVRTSPNPTPRTLATRVAMGGPHDPHEREADAVAAKVTGTSAPAQTCPGGCHHGGSPDAARGHDFTDVRVHTDQRAAESARTINAEAYTVGRDIYFASGKYAPHSSAGRNLLAHELTHVVQQVPGAAPVVRGKWTLSSVTPREGAEGDREHENGTAASYSFGTVGVFGSAHAWQEQGWVRTEVGGDAQTARWVTLHHVFKNDAKDRDFLRLDIAGRVMGTAKAEDLDHARAAGVVWGAITERTAANPTPPARQLFTPIEEGGISAATIGELGTIEVDLPLGDSGSVHATFPLTRVVQGAAAPFSESVQPAVDVSPDVDEVDVVLGARIEADASIESSYSLFAWLDDNRSNALAAVSLLDWVSRPSPAPRPAPPPTSEDPGYGAARKIRAQAICKCVGDDACGGGKIHRKYFEVEDCRDAKLAAEKICNNDPEMKEKCIRPKCYYRHGDYKCPA